MFNYKTGYVLSGGGARCIAHLGVLQALKEKGYQPDVISGTSGGAIIGAFILAGYAPDKILEIVVESKLTQFFKPAFSLRALLKLEKAKELFSEYLPDQFSGLPRPLLVAVTNITNGKAEILSTGSLLDAIVASSSIPVLFDPVKIGEDYYVDGGVLRNFPVEPLVKQCGQLIGMHCNPISENFDVEGTSFKSMVERSLIMALNYNSDQWVKYCDIFIEPTALETYKIYNLGKAREIYQIGYDEAVRVLSLEG